MMLRKAWKIINILATLCFITAALSPYISPAKFSYISLFGLGFPFILGGYIFCCITTFLKSKRNGILMFLMIFIGYTNIRNTFVMGSPAAWHDSKDSNTLRVMTWNVQGFSNYLRAKKSRVAFRTNRDSILATISEFNPGIICFQDYRNIENAKRRISIRKQLDSMGYTFYFSSHDRIGTMPKNPAVTIEEGVAIYSRFPIIDSGRININNEDKNENLAWIDIDFNNKPLRVITAHLKSFTIYKDTAQRAEKDENIYEITYKRRRAAEYKIRETEVFHEKEAKVISNFINTADKPVIYCGDLNITPTSYNYHLIRGDKLNDAFTEKGWWLGNTFSKIVPTLRIDVCLPDKEFSVQQAKREKRKLSDHYPVIADMKWK